MNSDQFWWNPLNDFKSLPISISPPSSICQNEKQNIINQIAESSQWFIWIDMRLMCGEITSLNSTPLRRLRKCNFKLIFEKNHISWCDLYVFSLFIHRCHELNVVYGEKYPSDLKTVPNLSTLHFLADMSSWNNRACAKLLRVKHHVFFRGTQPIYNSILWVAAR